MVKILFQLYIDSPLLIQVYVPMKKGDENFAIKTFPFSVCFFVIFVK